MSSRYIHAVFAVFTVILVIILGGSANAQGKGHGGGNHGGGNHGGPPAQTQVKVMPQHQPRFERQAQRQQPRIERQQPKFERQKVQRQMPQLKPGRQNRESQNAGRSRVDRQQQQQQQRIIRPDNNRVEQRRVEMARRNDLPRVDQRQFKVDRGQANGTFRQEHRIDSQPTDGLRGQGSPSWSNAWPNNHGFERSSEVHARNAERQALRLENRDFRQNVREQNWFARRFTYPTEFRQNQPAFEQREQWRENLLRSVVLNVSGANAGYYNNYYPVYQPNYYVAPYDPFYVSSVYYGGYSSNYANPPYDPVYSDFSSEFDPGYGQYALFSDVYDNDLSYTTLVDPNAGYAYSRQSDGELVTYGYDQGYIDGLVARDAGYGDRYFYDPYTYDEVIYDPYSSSLGENRRCLGKGYELGYMDALYRRDEYDPYADDGDVNIVTAFIGNVSIM